MEKSMDEGRTNGVLRDIELGIIPDPGELKAALEFTIQSPHVLCSVPERARNVIESSNIDAEDLGKVAFAIGVSNLDPAQKARLLQSVAVTPIADEITLLTVTTVALSCLHGGRPLIDVLRAVIRSPNCTEMVLSGNWLNLPAGEGSRSFVIGVIETLLFVPELPPSGLQLLTELLEHPRADSRAYWAFLHLLEVAPLPPLIRFQLLKKMKRLEPSSRNLMSRLDHALSKWAGVPE